uniref:Uncharacterized protein n=1 Tax=Pseudo-nitzschia australis TaxID=44445 RepID=A0A7S4ALF6_9STRA
MIFDFKSFSRWLAVTAAISACATKIHGPTTADAFALRPVTSSSNARSLSRTATIGLPRTSTIASTSTTATQQQQQQQQPRPLTIMYRIRCENKYYQLEELEDADNCTTELFLKHDGTVDVMETDGPLFSKAVGNWEIKENQFAMTITKTFATGTNNKSDPTGMGEFTFAVERVFEGEMTVVGGTEVAINGRIFAEDIVTDKMEKEVGFFNMIDGTEQRLERRADARPKNTGVLPSPIDSNDVKGHNGIPSEWVEPVAQQDAWLEEPQQQQQQQEWAEPQQQQEWAEPQQEWEQQQQQQQQQQQEGDVGSEVDGSKLSKKKGAAAAAGLSSHSRSGSPVGGETECECQSVSQSQHTRSGDVSKKKKKKKKSTATTAPSATGTTTTTSNNTNNKEGKGKKKKKPMDSNII